MSILMMRQIDELQKAVAALERERNEMMSLLERATANQMLLLAQLGERVSELEATTKRVTPKAAKTEEQMAALALGREKMLAARKAKMMERDGQRPMETMDEAGS